MGQGCGYFGKFFHGLQQLLVVLVHQVADQAIGQGAPQVAMGADQFRKTEPLIIEGIRQLCA